MIRTLRSSMNKKCFEHNCVNFSDRSKCVKERRAVTGGNPDWVTSIQFKPFFSPSASRLRNSIATTIDLNLSAWSPFKRRYKIIQKRVSDAKRIQLNKANKRRKGRKSIINFMCMHRIDLYVSAHLARKNVAFFVKRCAVDKTETKKQASDFKLKSAIESFWTLFMAEI